VIAETVGLFLSLIGFFFGLIWLRAVGCVLIAPAPLSILIMLVNAQLIRFGFPRKRGSSKDIIRVAQNPRS
jgi:cellulose synthase/poly-beta-1,6-N-acetylglucosamine synthase-like glycosyltransferase